MPTDTPPKGRKPKQHTDCVLVDSAAFLPEELRDMIVEDIATLRALALRYKGVAAELEQIEEDVRAGTVEPVEGAPSRLGRLRNRALDYGVGLSLLTRKARDLLDEVCDLCPEDAEFEGEEEE